MLIELKLILQVIWEIFGLYPFCEEDPFYSKAAQVPKFASMPRARQHGHVNSPPSREYFSSCISFYIAQLNKRSLQKYTSLGCQSFRGEIVGIAAPLHRKWFFNMCWLIQCQKHCKNYFYSGSTSHGKIIDQNKEAGSWESTFQRHFRLSLISSEIDLIHKRQIP
jgi:hypothetical protein